jgi:hypothetical protein
LLALEVFFRVNMLGFFAGFFLASAFLFRGFGNVLRGRGGCRNSQREKNTERQSGWAED